MNTTLNVTDRRWLVVDDNADVAYLLSLALNSLGLAEVEEFTSSTQASERIAQTNFDLIVTDRDMPGMDGLELARRVRTHSPNAKIVMVSAHLDDLQPEELRRAGICAVLAKPFSVARLESLIRSLVCEPADAVATFRSPSLSQAA
jgi:CheY-like chemotaxis protein